MEGYEDVDDEEFFSPDEQLVREICHEVGIKSLWDPKVEIVSKAVSDTSNYEDALGIVKSALGNVEAN